MIEVITLPTHEMNHTELFDIQTPTCSELLEIQTPLCSESEICARLRIVVELALVLILLLLLGCICIQTHRYPLPNWMLHCFQCRHRQARSRRQTRETGQSDSDPELRPIIRVAPIEVATEV